MSKFVQVCRYSDARSEHLIRPVKEARLAGPSSWRLFPECEMWHASSCCRRKLAPHWSAQFGCFWRQWRARACRSLTVRRQVSVFSGRVQKWWCASENQTRRCQSCCSGCKRFYQHQRLRHDLSRHAALLLYAILVLLSGSFRPSGF